MIYLYLVFQLVEGRCHGNQLILGKWHERRLIPLHSLHYNLISNLKARRLGRVTKRFLLTENKKRLEQTYHVICLVVKTLMQYNNLKLPFYDL